MSFVTKSPVSVHDARGLIAAIGNDAEAIRIVGRINGLPPLTLKPGQALSGANDDAMLVFDEEGLALTASNRIESLAIVAPSRCRSIRLADHPRKDARFELREITCHGMVQLIFGDETESASVLVKCAAIAGADASQQTDRPHANGVDVLQGAFTIWNRATRPTVVRVKLDGIDVGSPDHPVVGTGLFIAGSGKGTGGTIEVEKFVVGSVHSDSGLPEGTTGTVAGGVFVLQDVTVDTIMGTASVVTFGANAVPIDNWGRVNEWHLEGNVISHGPSAIGFVNAGTLNRLDISGDILTFGDGARGCGIYGPTGTLSARAVRTNGSAAIGVQVVDRLDRLVLSEGIFTVGAPGEGLVKGVMIETPAHGIHVEHGATLGEFSVLEISASGRGAQTMFSEGQVGHQDKL